MTVDVTAEVLAKFKECVRHHAAMWKAEREFELLTGLLVDGFDEALAEGDYCADTVTAAEVLEFLQSVKCWVEKRR